MLSRYLILPFGLVASVLGALAFYYDNGLLAIPAIVCVIVMIGIYFFSDAIDWWWFQKHPPKMDERMKNLLTTRFAYYRELNPEDRLKFENRVELFIYAKEFIPNGWKRIPYDLKVWIACCAIMLTFNKEDYVLDKFERIVLYPHSFPSPQYPKHIHASEIFEEDGVLLFSSEKLLPGVMQPRKFFNIGLYEFAKVFKIMNPDLDYSELDESLWPIHAEIVKYSKQQLENYIGLTDLDTWAVLVVLFFTYPDEMQDQLGEQYANVKETLNY